MFFLILSLALSHKTPTEAFRAHAQCRICRRIRETAKRDTTSTIQDFQKYISEKCETMDNSTRGLCKILALDWVDHIRSAKTDKEACDFACRRPFPKHGKNFTHKGQQRKHPRPARQIEPLGLLPCDACVTIVDISMSLAPEFLGNFDVNIFRKACQQIEMFQDRCHLFTDEVFANVIQYILQNLSPYELCVQYGMC